MLGYRKKRLHHLYYIGFVSVLMSFLAINSASALSGGSGTQELRPVPRACLPVRAIRTDNPNVCHCPPASYCNMSVVKEGNTYRKIPEQLYKRCCATVPSNNTCDSDPLAVGCTEEKMETCQVNFVTIPNPFRGAYEYNLSISVGYGQGAECMSTTIVGPRTARYCRKYELNGGGATVQTAMNAVNACIQANCSTFKNAVTSYNRGAVTYSQLKTNQILMGSYIFYEQEKKPVNDLVAYDRCHKNCLTTSGVMAWRRPDENNLSAWLDLRTHAPVPTAYNPAKGRYVALNGPVTANINTDKIWQQVNYSTINQKTWSLYFNSTTQPEKIDPTTYPKYSYELGDLDKFLGTPSAHMAKDNEFSGQNGKAFYKAMVDHNFQPVNQILQPNNTPYAPPVYPASLGVRCEEYEDFQTCIFTSSSNGACGSCLSPETKITLADGTTKLIKDIKIGDTLQAAHNITTTVEKVVKLDWPTLTLYNINDGALKLTPDHPIMTTKGWRAVNYNARGDEKNETRYGLQSVKPLTVGDVIVTEKGEVPVTRIMPEPEVKDAVTYNLKVKGDASSFYANGILVKSHK